MQRTLEVLFCGVTALLIGMNVAQAGGAYQTLNGVAGDGLAGVGAEGPPYQHFIDLDEPLTLGGDTYARLLTDTELPTAQHVTLCARVEVRHFEGIESHYNYGLITDISKFEACE
ncbi:MAG TPA: hypothetical protein VFH51_07515 [Myxococcota bacterium]|nr:hypothetical protein [Myxococcota bacterium]